MSHILCLVLPVQKLDIRYDKLATRKGQGQVTHEKQFIFINYSMIFSYNIIF